MSVERIVEAITEEHVVCPVCSKPLELSGDVRMGTIEVRTGAGVVRVQSMKPEASRWCVLLHTQCTREARKQRGEL